MPMISIAGVDLHYRVDGPEGAPWLVFDNALGTDLAMWDAQIPVLSNSHRCLRYDRRGHGQSSAPPGPYEVADLGRDLLVLLDHLQIARATFCGLSLGGVVGLWLAQHAPEHFAGMLLSCTAAKIGTREVWQARLEQLDQAGLPSMSHGTIERWFTPDFRREQPQLTEAVRLQIERTDPGGYAGCIRALAATDFREQLGGIRMPLLCLAGQQDPGTPPRDLQFIAERVPGARYLAIPGAHLCNIESASLFNAALQDFAAAATG